MKKSKAEFDIDLEAIKDRIENNIPSYISPNGGSLEGIQNELKEIYAILLNLTESLKDNVWDKGGEQ